MEKKRTMTGTLNHSKSFFSLVNRFGTWARHLRAKSHADLGQNRRVIEVLSGGRNSKTGKTRKSHLIAILAVIVMTLLGSLIGYVLVIFHQD